MAKYTPELYDKQSKVQFFYNEFKRRDANPDGFDCKMKNWFTSINKYCEDEDEFLVNLNELRDRFECMSIRPQVSCLKLVLTNMIKERKLLPFEEFKRDFLHNSTDNNGWLGWGFSSVKKTIGWFSSSVSTSSDYTETIDEQLNIYDKYVNLTVFDRITRKVLTYVKENNLIGQLLKYNEVEEELSSKLNLDKKQLELIIQFLECKGNCKTVEMNTKIIKFEEGNATISDKELSLMRLEDAKLMIEADVEKIEEEIEKCKEEAREAIKQNNKAKGMNILKKKLRLNQQLERKHNQYDNIETLEEQLLSTDTNKQILDVLAKSTQVLKSKQAVPDDVDDLLISVEEAMVSHNSLLHDLSKPIGVQFDDDELEDELNQLIAEDEIEKVASSSTNNDLTENKFKDISKTANQPSTAQSNRDEPDELFERLRKLKSPPTTSISNKKDKVRYALLDDDL